MFGSNDNNKKRVEMVIDADTVDKISLIANSFGEHFTSQIKLHGMSPVHEIMTMLVFSQVWAQNIQQYYKANNIESENQMNLTVAAQKLVKAKFEFKF